jgi:type II secretory pathway pseudopilin PulG
MQQWIMNYFRRIKHQHSLQQGGDTIVEVLIAISIVSLVLVGAFVTSNRSLQSTRDTQEHAEATKLAEAQIEMARSYIESHPKGSDTLFTESSQHCMTLSAPPSSQVQVIQAGTPVPLKSLETDDFSQYSSGCSSTQGDYAYNMAIENQSTNSDLDGDTVMVHIRWDKLGGGRDEVTLVYRDRYITP